MNITMKYSVDIMNITTIRKLAFHSYIHYIDRELVVYFKKCGRRKHKIIQL